MPPLGPVQPRTSLISEGAAITNLFPFLPPLSFLCVFFPAFSFLHVAACSLHPTCFCLEMGDEPEGVRFNPCVTKPSSLLLLRPLAQHPKGQMMSKQPLPAEPWPSVQRPGSLCFDHLASGCHWAPYHEFLTPCPLTS